jgi:hypothetical protein
MEFVLEYALVQIAGETDVQRADRLPMMYTQ